MRNKEYFAKFCYLVATGLLATFTMDIAAFLAVKSGLIQLGQHQIIPHLLGRWLGSIPSGRVFHSNILDVPPIPHEAFIGVLAHYSIGIILASLFVFPHLFVWHRLVRFQSAIFFGLATCVLPFFVMFPAMGFGALAVNLENAPMMLTFSVWNHVAFGAGISIWSNLLYPALMNRFSLMSFRHAAGLILL